MLILIVLLLLVAFLPCHLREESILKSWWIILLWTFTGMQFNVIIWYHSVLWLVLKLQLKFIIDNHNLIHFRIDKDVQRCDRNLSYFTDKNLEKLRNVITTYVWDNLDIGYMQVRWYRNWIQIIVFMVEYNVIYNYFISQGMCDLAGPLLVVFDDESLTHSCFSHLMERMIW